MTDFAAARYFMVEGQIRPNKVTDHRLVDVLSELPREAFVPESARGVAYVDDDLPIGKGRFVLEPMVFARMLQAVGVQETDRVLDVGAAGGYSTAVLARLAASVVGLDCDEDLTAAATAALAGQGIANAKAVTRSAGGGVRPRRPLRRHRRRRYRAGGSRRAGRTTGRGWPSRRRRPRRPTVSVKCACSSGLPAWCRAASCSRPSPTRCRASRRRRPSCSDRFFRSEVL